MADATRLLRLLSIRRAEEQQSRTCMEAAIAELRVLQRASDAAGQRSRFARFLIESSMNSGELEDRIAGLEEMAAADRLRTLLRQKIDRIEPQISELRQRFLAKRIERRQVEMLLGQRRAQAELEAKRKAQMALDDWHRATRVTGRDTLRGSEKAGKKLAGNPKPPGE